MDCLFCKIINGDIPSKKIYEDDLVLVIMDIHPSVNGHMLVIPKKHYTDYTEIDSDTLNHIYKIVNRLDVLNKLDVKGLSLVVNYGDKQDIKHYHLHILPNDKTTIKDVDIMFNKLI